MRSSYEDEVLEEGTYICVASFRSENKAKAMSIDLNVTGYEVIVRSALVKGSNYYRVLVGPVPADKPFQKEFKQWLSDMGYEGAWVLESLTDTSPKHFPDIDNKDLVLQQPKEHPQRMAVRAYPGEESDYNLARLRVVTD